MVQGKRSSVGGDSSAPEATASVSSAWVRIGKWSPPLRRWTEAAAPLHPPLDTVVLFMNYTTTGWGSGTPAHSLKAAKAQSRESASQVRAVRIQVPCATRYHAVLSPRGLECETIRLKGDQRPWNAGWFTSDCRAAFRTDNASFNITSY